ncbi:MAG: TIGR01212 family radical SAM protein, partial [Campylobacterales bacterium]|nr:TIGR01212 family radical SAM protein [Campylobacterales bacterium]
MRKQIFTFGQYLHRKFGVKVSKVPISISGFTCPNIDGTVAKGGCTFCENDSFSPSLDRARPIKGFFLNLESTTNPHLDQQLQQLEWQFNALSKKLHDEHGAQKFLVYFQSFTNTYAPLETLKALYEKALTFENVVGLSIGTRSD